MNHLGTLPPNAPNGKGCPAIVKIACTACKRGSRKRSAGGADSYSTVASLVNSLAAPSSRALLKISCAVW
jgi:hypothetical protein